MWKLAHKAGVASTIGFLLRRSSTPKKHVARLDDTLARAHTLHAKAPQTWRMFVAYLDASRGRIGKREARRSRRDRAFVRNGLARNVSIPACHCLVFARTDRLPHNNRSRIIVD
jgi:hypothetical protein